jgi:hypothetical protein
MRAIHIARSQRPDFSSYGLRYHSRSYNRAIVAVRPPANCWLRSTGGFTEGFDTRDLKEAKALLEEMEY